MSENSWKDVWLRKGRASAGKASYTASDLFAADGFDTALGKTDEESRAHIGGLIKGTLGIQPGQKVLEVGCGAGAVLSLLVDCQAKLSGVDFSAPHIEIARRAIPTADFQVAEACSLPFSDSEFEAVFSHGVFLYFESLDYAARVVAQMVRVATPTAPILILDVPDAGSEAECLKARAAAGASLHPAHLYYPKTFFEDVARHCSRRAVFSPQTVPGYGNAAFRYNVLLETH